MLLEAEQRDLLIKFVEAHRAAPREARSHFIAIETMGNPQAHFLHTRVATLRFDGSRADAEVLADAGLLRMSWNSQGSPTFYVLPEAVMAYEEMMKRGAAANTLENEVQRYLSTVEFRKHTNLHSRSGSARRVFSGRLIPKNNSAPSATYAAKRFRISQSHWRHVTG